MNDHKCVQIPKIELNKRKPVLAVDFEVYFRDKEHLIPDPFLVVLKAAVCWSAFRDQKLLPACPRDVGKKKSEELIPSEIFVIVGEDAAQADDDSVISLSEKLTGPPGDRNFEATPSGKTSVRMVTP